MSETSATPSGNPASNSKSDQEPRVLSVNQVVAHNLVRARRAKAWTQAETASRLKKVSGNYWTAETLGAAERSVESGRRRPRKFDANDLLTFSLVFNEDIAYFLLPPYEVDRKVIILMRDRHADDQDVSASASDTSLAARAVITMPSAQLVDDINRILAKSGMSWGLTYSKIDWVRPEEEADWTEIIASKIAQEGVEALAQKIATELLKAGIEGKKGTSPKEPSNSDTWKGMEKPPF